MIKLPNKKTYGGYQNLKSYQTTTLIYDLTVKFCQAYMTYKSNMTSPESAANCIICLIYQATYLLDKQLASLEKTFIEEGGYSESLFKRRLAHRPEGSGPEGKKI